MSSCRAVLVLAAAALAAACGKSGSPPDPEAARDVPPAPSPPPPVVDAAAAPSIVVPYELPTAHTLAPLPATPTRYVFLAGDGGLRAGTTPAFDTAATVPTYEALSPLGPSDPGAPGTITPAPGSSGVPAGPSGAGTGQGYAIGGGIGARGAPLPFHVTGERVAPARAQVVIVADRRARIEAVARAVAQLREPVALVVRAPDGTVGALALALGTGPAAAASPAYRITLDGARVTIMDVGAGTSRELAPDADLELDVARVRTEVAAIYASSAGAGATVALLVPSDDEVSRLIAALDAMADGTAPVAVIARRPPGGMRSGRGPVPELRMGNPDVLGSLDKSIIRRYLKRNQGRLKLCYEKQLLVRPSLEGTVIAEFVIGPRGDVPSSKASGVDPVVSRCIAEVIHGIQFPGGPGGGIVKVRYPFTLRPNGG